MLPRKVKLILKKLQLPETADLRPLRNVIAMRVGYEHKRTCLIKDMSPSNTAGCLVHLESLHSRPQATGAPLPPNKTRLVGRTPPPGSHYRAGHKHKVKANDQGD